MQYTIVITSSKHDLFYSHDELIDEFTNFPHFVTCPTKLAQLLTHQAVDLVIVPIKQGNFATWQLIQTVLTKSPETAIVTICEHTNALDRILSLEMGADECLSSPFDIREAKARLQIQLRHVTALKHKQEHARAVAIQLEQLHINTSSREVLIDGINVNLTATEFDLLYFFASHPHQVFSRSQLLANVWQDFNGVYEHTVNSHINRLRAKLDKAKSTVCIETVWGVGYKLTSPVKQYSQQTNTGYRVTCYS